VEQVLELTKGVGADKGCECVGYQCCDKHGTEHSNITMNELVQAVKATGSIGLLEFVPKDPKSKKNCRKRTHGF
jgi:threonine dehydrogenase-like Zn-dependent dehydrogenase